MKNYSINIELKESISLLDLSAKINGHRFRTFKNRNFIEYWGQ